MRLVRRIAAISLRGHLWLFRWLDPLAVHQDWKFSTVVKLGVCWLVVFCLVGGVFIAAQVWVTDEVTVTRTIIGGMLATFGFIAFAVFGIYSFIVFYLDLPCFLEKTPDRWQARLSALEWRLQELEAIDA